MLLLNFGVHGLRGETCLVSVELCVLALKGKPAILVGKKFSVKIQLSVWHPCRRWPHVHSHGWWGFIVKIAVLAV